MFIIFYNVCISKNNVFPAAKKVKKTQKNPL